MGKQTAIAIFLFLISAAVAADTPPPPFQLPTYNQENSDRPLLPPVPQKTPVKLGEFEPLRVLGIVEKCWPAASWFRADLSLEARGGRTFGTLGNNDQTQPNYAGIVARIPLYSATEIDREREREALRMQQAAASIGQIVQALVERQRAMRETELYEAIERRARLRVAEGVTDTAEQITALKQVADAHTDEAKAVAKLTAARLSLISLCQRDRASELNEYLTKTLGVMR